MHRVDLMEGQVERWLFRLPPSSIAEEMDEVRGSVELQEELLAFKGADRRRIEDIRGVIFVSRHKCIFCIDLKQILGKLSLRG